MITRTHINTLEDNTPKSRRRVRRTLAAFPPAPKFNNAVATAHAVGAAQDLARRRELAGARSDAEKRRAKP